MAQHASVAAHPGEAVDVTREGLVHYGMKQQVRFARTRGLQRELDMTGAERGLIVCMTSGTVITVSPSRTGRTVFAAHNPNFAAE